MNRKVLALAVECMRVSPRHQCEGGRARDGDKSGGRSLRLVEEEKQDEQRRSAKRSRSETPCGAAASA